MAYLNLRRFRYREQIRQCAKEQLSPLGQVGTLTSAITNTDQYKGLIFLAKLQDNDGLDGVRKNDLPSGKRPKAIWSFWYFIMFAFHEDLILGGIMSAISTILLLIGVALSIDMWAFALPIAHGAWSVFWFWLLLVGAVLPVIFVYAGRAIVLRGCEHAIDAGRQLAAIIQTYAVRAPKPANPRNPSNRIYTVRRFPSPPKEDE